MKSPVIAYVGWLLLASALGFYVYGIFEAVHITLGSKPLDDKSYSPVLSATMGSIQALLLANLGILLGISISKPGSGVAKQLMLNKSFKEDAIPDIPPPLELKEKVQLFAMVIYIISLIVCLIIWIKYDFSSDSKDVVSIIPESGKMFLGVILAYLTAVLSKQSD